MNIQNQFPCYRCGQPNMMGDNTCKRCGAPFQYYCPQCNSPISNIDPACSNCGNRLEWPVRSGLGTKNSAENTYTSYPSQRKDNLAGPLVGLVLVMAAVGVGLYYLNTIAFLKTPVLPSTDLAAPQSVDIPVADKKAPVISDIQVNNISANTAEIRWTTDEPSTSQVTWNAQYLIPVSTPQKEAMVVLHSMELSGLSEKTMYFYTVRSVDQSGNESVSDRMSFMIGKLPGNVKVGISKHSMYIEDTPPAGMKTYIRGQVINSGDLPVNTSDVEIVVKASVPGRGTSELRASLDPYPLVINPGEEHKFYVLVPNGTDPSYFIAAKVFGQ